MTVAASVRVTVANTGPVAGNEVVQLYVQCPKRADVVVPRYNLQGFSKVCTVCLIVCEATDLNCCKQRYVRSTTHIDSSKHIEPLTYVVPQLYHT